MRHRNWAMESNTIFEKRTQTSKNCASPPNHEQITHKKMLFVKKVMSVKKNRKSLCQSGEKKNRSIHCLHLILDIKILIHFFSL